MQTPRHEKCSSRLISLAATLVGIVSWVAQTSTFADETHQLVLSCEADNDLFVGLQKAPGQVARFDSSEEAVESARPGQAVLILADGYPSQRTEVSDKTYEAATTKKLRLFVEFPKALPGVKLADTREARWERGVIANDKIPLGLNKLRLLALHDCRYIVAECRDPSLLLGRVAGFDSAVYGLPKDKYPILFRTEQGTIVATTMLSNFVRARYAPSADWVTLWRHLLAELDPQGAPHQVEVRPVVRPAYAKTGELPAAVERESVGRLAGWYKNSRLLLTSKRSQEISRLLQSGTETVPTPESDESGDGSFGLLEGYASQILPDGSQLQRTPVRADCQAESAAVLAFDSAINRDERSGTIATNLLNYLYSDSELHGLERGNPRHPAFGLIAWGAFSPAWHTANYGDDNARTLLATMVAAAALESDKWDASMLKALWASARTTGKLGFRGDRVDLPELERVGWKALGESERVNYSPFFEAYSWACFLWAYDKTGEPMFLEKARTAIEMTMKQYPKGWRWGDNLDRTHMLLALAWLVRVDDTSQHRQWLDQVARDLIQHQQPCGAIPERLVLATTGHYVVPPTNEAYGTSETPLIHREGDPISDQLYTTSFILLGLHEAVAVTDDAELRAAEDKLAEYVVRIQVQSTSIPYLNGTWFRAFDYDRWDYWASSGDMGWGAWAAETGWGPAWSGIVLGLREKQTSLWDFTSKSRIATRVAEVKQLMAENDGSPWMSDQENK